MLFIETKFFSREISNCLDDEEYNALQLDLMSNPGQGDIVPGLLGGQKLRWKTRKRGKRGGVRVIYYYKLQNKQIWMLAVYAKNKKQDLTETDKNTLRILIKAIKDE